MNAAARYRLPWTVIASAAGRLDAFGDDEVKNFLANQRTAPMPDLSNVTTLPFLNFDGVAKTMRALGLELPEESDDVKAAAEQNAFGRGRKVSLGYRVVLPDLDAALAKTKLSRGDKINLKSALNMMGLLA